MIEKNYGFSVLGNLAKQLNSAADLASNDVIEGYIFRFGYIVFTCKMNNSNASSAMFISVWAGLNENSAMYRKNQL